MESKILVEDLNKWWPAECDNCGWCGSSEELDGGHQIADTGDHSDPLCPVCGSAKVDETDNEITVSLRADKAHAVIKKLSYEHHKAINDNYELVSLLSQSQERCNKLYNALHDLAHQYKEEIRLKFPKDDKRSRNGHELDEWIADLPAYEAAKQLLTTK
jgi:hypothetical protein